MTPAVAERPKPVAEEHEKMIEELLAEQAKKLHESQPSLSLRQLVLLVVAAFKGDRNRHVQL
jgi:hypothetical protein